MREGKREGEKEGKVELFIRALGGGRGEGGMRREGKFCVA